MITFYSTSPQLAVRLRDPDFNDVNLVETFVRVNHAMDGTIFAHKSKLVKRLKFVFSEVGRKKSLEFQNFLEQNSGKKIWILDHENVRWNGYILTSPLEAVTVSRGLGSESRKESDTITIEFDGVKL